MKQRIELANLLSAHLPLVKGPIPISCQFVRAEIQPDIELGHVGIALKGSQKESAGTRGLNKRAWTRADAGRSFGRHRHSHLIGEFDRPKYYGGYMIASLPVLTTQLDLYPTTPF